MTLPIGVQLGMRGRLRFAFGRRSRSSVVPLCGPTRVRADFVHVSDHFVVYLDLSVGQGTMSS